ncbi:signal peptidase I [uncultured Dietzia sp.]|uniref:signal peptidase I n=1 Tax=uncultured Dietzia sp. TaxID=395519 RepID=UPI0025DF0CAD|nr:signal peptidase I [uncultured Dietzia sp.]
MTSVVDRPAAVAEADSEQTGVWWWIRTVTSWLLLLVAVAVLAALVVVPRLAGATPYTVLTGSMEPTLSPGTLIVVKPVPATELRAGDVITFQTESDNPAVNTHRITQVVYDAQGTPRFQTQGDANNVTDRDLLVSGQIRGKYWYSVPYLGYANNALTGDSRQLLLVVAIGGLGAYALWMFGSSVADARRNRSDAADAGSENNDESL